MPMAATALIRGRSSRAGKATAAATSGLTVVAVLIGLSALLQLIVAVLNAV